MALLGLRIETECNMNAVIQEHNELDEQCLFPVETVFRFKIRENGVKTNYFLLIGNFTSESETLDIQASTDSIDSAIETMMEDTKTNYSILCAMAKDNVRIRADIWVNENLF